MSCWLVIKKLIFPNSFGATDRAPTGGGGTTLHTAAVHDIPYIGHKIVVKQFPLIRCAKT